MTAKRFTMGYKVYRDNLTGERYDEVTESYKICELLNELHEENQRLKRDNKDLKIYLEQANSSDNSADDKND